MSDKDKSTQSSGTGTKRPADALTELGTKADSAVEAASPAIEEFVKATNMKALVRGIRLKAYESMGEDAHHRTTPPPRHTREGEEFDAAMRLRIGRKVRAARERFGNTKSRTSYGMPRHDLASLAGIYDSKHRPSEAGIQHIEDGRTVTATDVMRISAALGVPVTYLMGPMTLTLQEARQEVELTETFRMLSAEDKRSVLGIVRRMKDAFTE